MLLDLFRSFTPADHSVNAFWAANSESPANRHLFFLVVLRIVVMNGFLSFPTKQMVSFGRGVGTKLAVWWAGS